MRTSTCVGLASILVWLTACGSTDPATMMNPPSAGISLTDAGAGTDAGLGTDAAQAADRDVSSPHDGGTLGDVPVVTVTDAGSPFMDTGTAVTDTGVTVTDTGVAVTDTGTVVTDTGRAVTDAGTAVTDTGVTVTDAGTPAMDTGPRDTGITVTDTGPRDTGVMVTDTGPRDTGVTGMDTGSPATDAGMPAMDAGMPGVDAGARDTGGTSLGGGSRDTGVDVPAPDVGITPGGTGPDPVAYTGRFPAGYGNASAQLTTAVEGAARDVALYVPHAVGGAQRPLLMLFHGTNGSGPQMLTDTSAQTVADTYGVVVAAPSSNWIGHGDWDHATEETYWLTYPYTDPTTNPDLVLVRAIIAEAIRAYNIDQTRVYAIGHSSGAFFTLLIAETLQDRVAAIASSSGGLVRCPSTRSCSFMTSAPTCAGLSSTSGWCACTGVDKPGSLPVTGRHPAAWLGHGTNDPLVSVQYTCTLEAAMSSLGYTVETHLRIGDGHVMPDNFAPLVWPFLSAHVRL